MIEDTLSIDSGVLTLSSLETQVGQLHEQIRATQETQEALTSAAGALAEYLHEFNETEPMYNLGLYSDNLADVGRKIKGVDQVGRPRRSTKHISDLEQCPRSIERAPETDRPGDLQEQTEDTAAVPGGRSAPATGQLAVPTVTSPL